MTASRTPTSAAATASAATSASRLGVVHRRVAQGFGRPGLDPEDYPFKFTPVERPGAKWPQFKNKICHGLDLSHIEAPDQIELGWLKKMLAASNEPEEFFTPFFDKLAGTDELRKQLAQGIEARTIRASWKQNIESFKRIRAKYLLYP